MYRELSNKEIKSLKFHIKSDDTFGTLATIVNLFPVRSKFHLSFKKKIVAMLMYLHENHRIVEK